MNIEISPKEYERQLNWNDGMLYCQLLTIDNKNDWRLPTKEELDYIYHSENDFTTGFIYWTSTEYDSDGNAWFYDFSGHLPYYYSSKYDIYNVRPVRTIE